MLSPARLRFLLYFAFSCSFMCPMLPAAGCVRADATALVRVRAAKDLVCDEKHLTVQRGADGYYRANGCGKGKTYFAVCESTHCAVSQRGERPRVPNHQGVLQPQQSVFASFPP